METENANSFDEWEKFNPNGNLNEFYTYVRKNKITIAVPIPTKTSVIYELNPVDPKATYISLIIGCLSSLLGLIGYFTPWFSLPIFNISISGNEINQLSNLLNNYYEFNENLKRVNFIKFTYLIPISYILICLGSIVKSYFLTIITSIINLVFVGLIVGFIFYNIPEAFSIISYGIYITILSWLIILYNVFTLKY